VRTNAYVHRSSRGVFSVHERRTYLRRQDIVAAFARDELGSESSLYDERIDDRTRGESKEDEVVRNRDHSTLPD